MAKSVLLLSNINDNVKNKINSLKIEDVEGVEGLTFTNNSASILFNDSIIDANSLVAIINSSKDINGIFQENEEVEKMNEENKNVHCENGEYVNKLTFCPNEDYTQCNNQNCYIKKTFTEKNTDDEINSTELIYWKDNVTSLHVHDIDKDMECGIKDTKHVNTKIREPFGNTCGGKNYYENEYQEIYNKNVNDGFYAISGSNEDTDNVKAYEFDNKIQEHHVNNNMLRDVHIDNTRSRNVHAVESTYNYIELRNEQRSDKDHLESEKLSVFELLKNNKGENSKLNKYYNVKIDSRRGIMSQEKEFELGKGNSFVSNHSRSGNIFQDYETYRGKRENMYICELRIYNMTCDNCGNKIISFLKDKNLIVDGYSFATDSKIKLKLDVSEGNSYRPSSSIDEKNDDNKNSIKIFVNKIMSEIKDSGFNNDLIDLYKEEDNNNKDILFDITLYVFRDDVIKAHGLLKSLKGIKSVEYDVRQEYIYILYNPDVIGIRLILEILKKQKNIDAYYDEDKEKYFRSTRNNETNNSLKLIELICCFFLSIMIIILNNYQMNMGSMNGFYSYGNYKSYMKMFNFLHFGNVKDKIYEENFTHEPSIESNAGKNNFPEFFFSKHYFSTAGEEDKEMTKPDRNSVRSFGTNEMYDKKKMKEFQKVESGNRNKNSKEKKQNSIDHTDKYELDPKAKGHKNSDNSTVSYPEGIDVTMTQDKLSNYEQDSKNKNLQGRNVLEKESIKMKHGKVSSKPLNKYVKSVLKEKQTKEGEKDNITLSDKSESKMLIENHLNSKLESGNVIRKNMHSSMNVIPNSNFFLKVYSNISDKKKENFPEINEIDFLFDFRRDFKRKEESRSLNSKVTSNDVVLSCLDTTSRKDAPVKDMEYFRSRFSRGLNMSRNPLNKKTEVQTRKEDKVEFFHEGNLKEEDVKNCIWMKKKNSNDEPKNTVEKNGLLKSQWFLDDNTLYDTMMNMSISTYLDNKIFGNLPLRLLLIFLLSSIVYIYFGFHFVLSGYKNLKNGIINMNVLISISSSFSYFYSLLLLLFCLFFYVDLEGIPLYFDSSALLICIMRMGFEIENFLVSFTKKKMEDLYEKNTKHVYILEKRNDKTDDSKTVNEQINNCPFGSSQSGKNNISILNIINSNKDDIVFKSGNQGLSPTGSGALSNFCKNSDNYSRKEFKIANGRRGGEEEEETGYENYNNAFHRDKPKEINISKIFCEDKKININDFIINSYPVQFIQKYDMLVFYEGDTLLVDGIKMNDDISYVDESMISGEKKAITKFKGDKIYAGSKCMQGVIILYIDNISKGNYIEYVKKTLDEVNCKKTNLQLYADKIASIFIPFIIGLCVAVFFIWFILTYFEYVNIKKDNYFKLNKLLSCIFFSIHFSLSILCVACPCAVGLASPLSIAISSYICSTIGIIIKNINIFDIFLECNHFIFDKTGTLTIGKPVVNKVYISTNLEMFTDQLLKGRGTPRNNLEVNFTYDNMPNGFSNISNDENQFRNFHPHKRKGKNAHTKTSITDDNSEKRMYNHNLDTSSSDENLCNINDKTNEVSVLHTSNDGDKIRKDENIHLVKGKMHNLLAYQRLTNENEEKKVLKEDRNRNNNRTLNFIESLNCSGRNVTFYSFTTQKDYYKIEIKKSLIRTEERSSDRSLTEMENVACSGKKSIFNRIVSFINNKRKKSKYNKIGNKSLKEYFINDCEISISSYDDDSYTSETSSENNDTSITDTENRQVPYGEEYENKHMRNINNERSFDDKNNLSEKIKNWLYLFLSLSSNLEKYSNHLYATSINTYVNTNFCINETFDIQNLKNEKNQGITGVINDLSVTIGTLYYCYTKYKNSHCCHSEEAVEEKLNMKNFEANLYSCDCNVHKTYQYLYNYSNSKKNESNNIIFMCIEGIIVGFFTLVDDIKPEVFDLIRYLKKERKKVYVCTGDNYMNAIYISKILGIPKRNVSSNTLPMEKVHFVKKIQSLNNGKVCMIGDGINDCFALKSADLGLSLSTRSNVVMDSADACIVDNNLSVIIKLFEISRKTLIVIKFNFLFSFIINIFFILLASGSFYALNYVFSPFLFTFLMFCSSIVVILSSLSLKL
ncbi:copper-transporting ATPase [Plasmodium gonderi]|uniref:Copper-transporting ATPase n=1 Tax=Plasmodium gonderi TaxID=77519 RepID=A0A1Y1JI48_PLAGO|nr:copper-transporting ATPase [Plasmodium gonderi]GAW80113.1 copper-transporting ATPase [Plasmodium gonderi]